MLMTAAFGVMGAFIATPFVASSKAFYENIFERKEKSPDTDRYVEPDVIQKDQ